MPNGLNPRQVANQLVRCFRAEVDAMRVLGGWVTRVTENEERLAFARDIGFRAEHGDALLSRLHRLRTTDRMIHVPSETWKQFIQFLDTAPSTADLVAGVYLLLGKQLVEAYLHLVEQTDDVADEPTVRMLTRQLWPDQEERIIWANQFIQGRQLDQAFQTRLAELLAAAGGLIVRSDDIPPDRDDPQAECGTGFWALPSPNPESIVLGSEYRIATDGETASYCPPYEAFGPHDVEVLVVHHGLMPEISSLALVGAILHEVHDRPWEFYRDFATQCADEVRHISLLRRRLEEMGAGPEVAPFPTWTLYDAVAYLPVAERTLVFNTIVEGNVVETLHDRVRALRAAGNADTAYVMDWISADESLHLHNGMRWLNVGRAGTDEILNRGQALLATVMRQKDVTNKTFDSASEDLSGGDFYAPRKNPIAPISRKLGGFTDEQIDRLIESAGGRTIRL